MTGVICGLYTVREFDSIGSDRQAHWKCECVCGERRIVRGRDLRSGNSKSCGCKGADRLNWKPPKVTTRKCKSCMVEKHLSEFPPSASRRMYQFRCNECIDKKKSETVKYRREWRDKYNVRNREERLDVLKHYGGKCACCGEDVPIFLAFDHINGGGHRHKNDRMRKKYSTIASWLKSAGYPKEFQVLCNNCNWAKHANKLCPHQVENTVSLLSFGG